MPELKVAAAVAYTVAGVYGLFGLLFKRHKDIQSCVGFALIGFVLTLLSGVS